MSFLHWIGHVLGAGVSKVEDLLGYLRKGLTGLWHILTGLGHNVTKAWHRFTNAMEWLLGWLESVAQRVAVLLRWLYRTVIPAAVRHAIAAAATFAQGVANAVASWARGALAYLRDHLVAAINAVESWARSAVRWITDHLAQVASDLARTMRRVWSLLDDPVHLAEWAAGAIAAALLRWAQRNAVTLGRWFVRHAVSLAHDEAGAIEDAIARIL